MHKQFAQTLSGSFPHNLQETGGQLVQTVLKLFAQTALLFGWVFFFFRVGFPFINFGQKRKASFYRGSFRKFLLVSLGEGFGVGFRWVVGDGFPVEGGGWGGWGVGWGQTKEPASQCARVCQNYPSTNYPFSFSPITTRKLRENLVITALSVLVFFGAPCFYLARTCFLSEEFLVFLSVFPLHFQGFQGFGMDKKSLFFGWLSLPFSQETKFSQTTRKGRTRLSRKISSRNMFDETRGSAHPGQGNRLADPHASRAFTSLVVQVACGTTIQPKRGGGKFPAGFGAIVGNGPNNTVSGFVWFRAPSSVTFFGPHRVPGRELSDFLSAYY